MKSEPSSTWNERVSSSSFDTNAPFCPCARTAPTVAVSSWFMFRIRSCPEVFRAPSPSGMPVIS